MYIQDICMGESHRWSSSWLGAALLVSGFDPQIQDPLTLDFASLDRAGSNPLVISYIVPRSK